MKMKNAVIIASFYGNPKHVGVYRVQRIIDWLIEDSYTITVITSGLADSVEQHPLLKEIVIKDPLKLDLAHRSTAQNRAPIRKPNSLRRFLAFSLLLPDAHIFWSWRVSRSPVVKEACKQADFILSSSPLESQHIAAYLLSKYSGTKMVVDMRDGWIDEPLKLAIQKRGLRRTFESFIEATILKRASLIFVTTRIWAEKLNNRLPFTASKTVVITNAYPPFRKEDIEESKIESEFEVIHAGQLKNSSLRRDPSLMFMPIVKSLSEISGKYTLSFYGKLDGKEIEELHYWEAKLKPYGWKLKIHSYVSRLEILRRMMGSSGLLSFSVSESQLPYKLFEYLYLGKPVLVFTTKGSAVWDLAQEVPQFYLVDYQDPSTYNSIVRFFNRGCCGDVDVNIPSKYSPEELKKLFLDALQKVMKVR